MKSEFSIPRYNSSQSSESLGTSGSDRSSNLHMEYSASASRIQKNSRNNIQQRKITNPLAPSDFSLHGKNRNEGSLLGSFFIFLISGLRPLLGTANCAYDDIGCTEFAIAQLQEKNIFAALFFITRRVLLCNPIGQYFLRDRSCKN